MVKTKTKHSDAEQLVRSKLDELIQFRSQTDDIKEFWGKQFDLGLAWVQFPEGAGGLGLNPKYQLIITETLRNEGISQQNRVANILGIGMGAPTIVEYGTPEQIQTYLRPMFTTEEIWCQLFSEPGSGSDLASLSTKAVDDGDGFIVNGQKVWTTLGHLAKWGLIVTRTDPDVPKHRGLTFFIVDMESDGVDVRPLRQITGEAEFNEVYFTDVKIPDSQRLGEIGDGWKVSLTTLMNERLAVGDASGVDFQEIFELAKDQDFNGDAAISNGAVREKLADWYCEQSGLKYTKMRNISALSQGSTPGPEASITKIVSANKLQDIANYGMDLMDNASIARDDETAIFQGSLLGAPLIRIAGGTDEVLKNIIAEQVLGMPQDIRVDKNVPFNEIPTGSKN